MKLKKIIWYTGIWLYPFIEISLQVVNYYASKIINKSIPQKALLILPLPLIFKIFTDNLKRQKRGHTDFGFKDAIGASIPDEETSLAKFKAAYPIFPKKLLCNTPSGLVLSKAKDKYVSVPLGSDGVNIFTIGATGSGKSVMIQNVLRSNIITPDKFNWALIDIKGEHYRRLLRTSHYKAKSSNIIHVIEPANRDSFGWDVFYSLQGASDTVILKRVTDIADALVCKSKDPYFEVNGKKIMTGLLFFYIKEGIDFIPAIQNISRNKFGDLIEKVVEQSESKGYTIVLDKLQSFVGKDDNESIQDVEATMKTYLDVFSYPDIVFALHNNKNKTSPNVLSDGKTCLDIAIEESMLSTYEPLFRLITSQILKYCEDKFKESDNRRTMVIIDEAARCSKLPSLENALSTLRNRHTSIWVLYQDISQFRDIYGNAKADTLLNLCEVKIFLSGSGDKATCDYVSNMAGEYEAESLSYSKGGLFNSPKDAKFTKVKRPIVTTKNLMELRKKKEAIAFIYGEYYRFKKLMYFEDSVLNDEALTAEGGSYELR